MPEEYKQRVLINTLAANVLSFKNTVDTYTKIMYLDNMKKIIDNLEKELLLEKNEIEKSK